MLFRKSPKWKATKTESELNKLAKFLDIAIKYNCNVEFSPDRVKQIWELVKKAQPRAVITDHGFTLCPHCESDVDEYDEYCRQCGQHLL